MAGLSTGGIESADEPEFAEEVINNGMGIVPFSILPHADNSAFLEVIPVFRKLHQNEAIIELKDSQAVVFENGKHRTVDGQTPTKF